MDIEKIWGEYQKGTIYKQDLGRRGMYEQNRINERMYAGDQWYGAKCGDKPLVRNNIIKRIGEYKMAVVGASAVSVNYSAEGIPNTVGVQDTVKDAKKAYAEGAEVELPEDENTALAMSALSDYYSTTAERLKLNDLYAAVMKNAYIGGSGVLYTYWDEAVATGLYADAHKDIPITGDVMCQALCIENVYFGNPNEDDVQRQPYIICAERRSVKSLRDEARRNRRPQEDIDAIQPDLQIEYQPGDRSQLELLESKKALCLTKFYKKDGTVHAVKVVRGATIRPEWDLKIRMYPFAKFDWEKRESSAYGDSEITYLVPNQIAINRMLTASVWSVMMYGMPMMMVNRDIVGTKKITNSPGQIIDVNAGSDNMTNAIQYVNPPQLANFQNFSDALINSTLNNAGATDTALGNVRPDNTSAIIAAREAATTPLQLIQNRYYSFIEDAARIFAEFWIMMYGKRRIKISDENGTWYMPFDGDKYKNAIVSAKIDIGASTLWSETQTISVLDSLLTAGVINQKQYLERMPKGVIPDVTGLLEDLQASQPQGEVSTADEIISQLPADQQAQFRQLDPEMQAKLLQDAGVMQGGQMV